MKKAEVVAIAPYAELQNTLKDVAEDFSGVMNTDIFLGDLSDAIKYVHNYSAKKYDLIISRGGTAKLLQSVAAVPVVEIETSAYDMLRAIRRAQQYNAPFVVFGFSNITSAATLLKGILQLPYDVVEIDSETAAAEKMASLLGLNYNTVFIGDAVTVRTAKTLGASSVLITSGRESVHKAFQDALYYLKNIGGYHENQNIFKAVIAELPLPVLIFDRLCNLLFHNLSGNYFSLFSMMELFNANIQRLQEKREIKFVCRDGRQLFQITGKRIEYNQETLYAFYIFHAAAKVFGSSFFQYETFENYDKELRLLHLSGAGMAQLASLRPDTQSSCFSYYIQGAVGTGKRVAAMYLHKNSAYGESAMLTIDCKQLNPANWMSFIEPVHSPLNMLHNTLYLRDIHLLTPQMQMILCEYIRDTRLKQRFLLLSSSSENLAQRIVQGTFLQDLYIQLTDVVVTLPSLAQRPDDIPAIAAEHINQCCEELGREVIGFEPKAVELLQSYPWPLNLLQFKNVVRQLVADCRSFYNSRASLRKLLDENTYDSFQLTQFDFTKPLAEIELDVIRYVLNDVNMNQQKAAQRLGISRSTLWRKLSSDQHR